MAGWKSVGSRQRSKLSGYQNVFYLLSQKLTISNDKNIPHKTNSPYLFFFAGGGGNERETVECWSVVENCSCFSFVYVCGVSFYINKGWSIDCILSARDAFQPKSSSNYKQDCALEKFEQFNQIFDCHSGHCLFLAKTVPIYFFGGRGQKWERNGWMLIRGRKL